MTHQQESQDRRGLTMVAQGQSLPQTNYIESNITGFEVRSAIGYEQENFYYRYIARPIRRFITNIREICGCF